MAIFDAGNYPVIDTQGAQTNPTNATVMADTGALDAGLYHITLVLGTTTAVATQWSIQRRNAANGANVGDVPVIYTNTATSRQYSYRVVLEASERVRVLTQGITGTACANIWAERLT